MIKSRELTPLSHTCPPCHLLDTVDDKSSEFDVGDEDEESSFDLADAPESDIQNLPLQDKVNEFYESIPKIYTIDKNAPLEYKANFRIDPRTKQLKVMYKRKLQTLTAANNPKQFLALNTIAANYGKGGVAFVRDVLGVQEYGRGAKPQKIPPKVETAAITVSQTTPVENIELQNLDDTLDRVSESIENLETEMQDAGVKTDTQRQDIGIETDLRLQQNLRDLERAHQFIGTMKGQVKASAAKISALDEQITQLKNERDTVVFNQDGVEIDGARIREINEEIEELRQQRDLHKNI